MSPRLFPYLEVKVNRKVMFWTAVAATVVGLVCVWTRSWEPAAIGGVTFLIGYAMGSGR